MKAYPIIALMLAASPVAAQEQGDNLLAAVAASRVAVISDGDFLASTYADAVLAPAGRHADTLTVFTIRDGRVTRSAIEASNSVVAAPEILAAAADGRTFYVVDRLGRATAEARRTPDLPLGRTLTVIRVADDDQLSVAATVDVPQASEALALSPDGQWLAIVGNEPTRSVLTMVPLRDGLPGEPVLFEAGSLGLTGSGEGPRAGLLLTNVQWSPDGRTLAVNDTTGNRVAFFRFEAAPSPTVSPWGAPVAAGRDPFVGRFTQDGRHYLTSEWGRNFAASDLNGRVPTTPGTLGITRLNEDGAHVRTGEIASDNSPEGLAISPDGRLIATINMRSTSFSQDLPRFTREATVSLFAFDPETGTARKLGDTPFEGVLPEGGTFDATGEHLLVTVFQGHEGQRDQAGIAVFRIEGADDAARLVEVGRVATPHGAHHVVAVR